MKLASYLWQSRHGIFYIRYNHNGLEIKRSLYTRDPKTAQSIAYRLNAMNPSDVIKKIQSGQTLEWTLKTQNIEVTTDGSVEDHKNAMQALSLILSSKQHISSVQHQPQVNSKLIRTSLKDAVDQYLIERESTVKERTLNTWRYEFNQLIAAFGQNTIVADIVTDMYINFRKQKIDKLAPSSMDSRNSTYKNFFAWCIERGRAEINPVVALKLSKGMRQTMQDERGREREPFDKADLDKLFNDEKLEKITKPCLFWMPLIALLTGAREEEIAHITVDSVKEYDINKYQFTIKKSKTPAGIRTIPIHPRLIELGFLIYVNEVKKIWGDTATLFPYMTAVKSRLTHRFSQDFGEYKRSLDIGITKNFHSFRSTAIGVLKINKVSAELRREYVGHESIEKEDTHMKNYSSKTKYPLKHLEEEVLDKFDYKSALDFDLSVSAYTKDRFTRYLKSSKIRKAALKSKALADTP